MSIACDGYVYIRNEADGSEEIFNDREDPAELYNQAGDTAMRPVLERFRRRLDQWKTDSHASAQFGIETVFNFLAPDAPDRYIEFAGQRHPLRYAGVAASPEATAPEITIADLWQQVQVRITAPGAQAFWISPIEAVSDSEGGFERVYQGSQILGVWPVDLEPHSTWTGRLVVAVSPST